MYALRHLFEDMDSRSGQQTEQDGGRWDVNHDGSSEYEHGGVKHLDGAPRIKSLNELVAQFRPFEAPPAPQPFSEHTKASSIEKKHRTPKPKQTRYATTMLITESTSETGQTTYTASTSPFVRLPEGSSSAIDQPSPRTTSGRSSGFRERRDRAQRAFFLRRQQESRVAHSSSRSRSYSIRNAPSAARLNRMLLISVKRQRKLKMKKHKYKKLMKRTRNLRRRQDRA